MLDSMREQLSRAVPLYMILKFYQGIPLNLRNPPGKELESRKIHLKYKLSSAVQELFLNYYILFLGSLINLYLEV